MWKLIVSRMKMGTRCEGCHVACCIRMQSAKRKWPKQQTKLRGILMVVFLFSSSPVLAQSFTKGKGHGYLLLTYSND